MLVNCSHHVTPINTNTSQIDANNANKTTNNVSNQPVCYFVIKFAKQLKIQQKQIIQQQHVRSARAPFNAIPHAEWQAEHKRQY